MKLVIGVDEAGYGPNLGPLVVCASAWVSDGPEAARKALDSEHFGPHVRLSNGGIPLGDSKQVYDKKIGFQSLALPVDLIARIAERQAASDNFEGNQTRVFPKHSEAEEAIQNGAAFLSHCLGRCPEALLPWYQQIGDDSNCQPLDLNRQDVHHAETTLQRCHRHLDEASIRLVGLASDVIDERRFNRGCDEYENKASLLSVSSIHLADRLLQTLLTNHQQRDAACESSSVRVTLFDCETWARQFDSIEIVCDRHGGRKRYHSLLSHVCPDTWYSILKESTFESCYQGQFGDTPLEWNFVCKADTSIAPAFASMLAKGIREFIMLQFNAFWMHRCAKLRPTAGYPVDAKRFVSAIGSETIREVLPLDMWWRSR